MAVLHLPAVHVVDQDTISALSRCDDCVVDFGQPQVVRLVVAPGANGAISSREHSDAFCAERRALVGGYRPRHVLGKRGYRSGKPWPQTQDRGRSIASRNKSSPERDPAASRDR